MSILRVCYMRKKKDFDQKKSVDRKLLNIFLEMKYRARRRENRTLRPNNLYMACEKEEV